MSNKPDNRNLGAQGNKDKLSGKAKEAGGKAQKNVGKMTGNESLEVKGRTREAGGNLQQGAGKVKRKADDVVDDVTR
ncbi:MAG TPA: CsbD family protein [Ktedonobacterales bacterium]